MSSRGVPISRLKPGWGWDTVHPRIPGYGNHPDADADPTADEMRRMDQEEAAYLASLTEPTEEN